VAGIPAATALIESSAAAEAGGKTGLTALSAAVMFLLMLLFTPVALMIPKATAPALILIGLNMFSGLRKVDLQLHRRAAGADDGDDHPDRQQLRHRYCRRAAVLHCD
jgi:xanthine/uracil/vitamin C permease (AzgA family)